ASFARIVWIHCFTNSAVMGMLVRDGGPGGISFPFLVPSPMSLCHGSVLSCGPNAETGNEADVPSLATHPMIGTVSALWMPCAAFASRKWVYGGTVMFS